MNSSETILQRDQMLTGSALSYILDMHGSHVEWSSDQTVLHFRAWWREDDGRGAWIRPGNDSTPTAWADRRAGVVRDVRSLIARADITYWLSGGEYMARTPEGQWERQKCFPRIAQPLFDADAAVVFPYFDRCWRLQGVGYVVDPTAGPVRYLRQRADETWHAWRPSGSELLPLYHDHLLDHLTPTTTVVVVPSESVANSQQWSFESVGQDKVAVSGPAGDAAAFRWRLRRLENRPVVVVHADGIVERHLAANALSMIVTGHRPSSVAAVNLALEG